MLKVWVAPTRTCPVRPPPPGLSMAMPWSTSFSARTAKPRNSSPASVVTTFLPIRSNRGWPTSSSSWRIWCDRVDWVTCTRAAARVKLRCSARATK